MMYKKLECMRFATVETLSLHATNWRALVMEVDKIVSAFTDDDNEFCVEPVGQPRVIRGEIVQALAVYRWEPIPSPEEQ